MSHKLYEVLRDKHSDLENDLRVYGMLSAMEDKGSIFGSVPALRQEVESHLISTLDIDVEEVEEEEDSLRDGIVSAFQDADGELKIFMTMERNMSQLKNAGASEEELDGYKKFQKRLESVMKERYNIKDEDLVEEKEDE